MKKYPERLMAILSLLSLLFMNKKQLLRFLPSGIFISLILCVESILADAYHYWRVPGGKKREASVNLSFIFGPFFTGTLWIFHLTYGKFFRYLLANSLMDFLLAYPIAFFFQKKKLFKLLKFQPPYMFGVSMIWAVVIYGYQMLIEKTDSKKEPSEFH
ncbi:hypothetical protein CEF21_06570 [Bacillus sp. FJAT-42376]|uniref:hypothetical protein n=1 Tax=Bacillus sp. FJAT-42376 TaxID=2014076 RepID=UPI000F4E7C58|nr:hypothetical protein [Bacillus sp. FJAT-42376]AZB41982.1 hypothetical protein CEF21_06570 [Bacillus sp. FJAT-42376]